MMEMSKRRSSDKEEITVKKEKKDDFQQHHESFEPGGNDMFYCGNSACFLLRRVFQRATNMKRFFSIFLTFLPSVVFFLSFLTSSILLSSSENHPFPLIPPSQEEKKPTPTFNPSSS